jgi:hypothetical protein
LAKSQCSGFDVPIPERLVVKFKPGNEMHSEFIKIPPLFPAKIPPQQTQPTQAAICFHAEDRIQLTPQEGVG